MLKHSLLATLFLIGLHLVPSAALEGADGDSPAHPRASSDLSRGLILECEDREGRRVVFKTAAPHFFLEASASLHPSLSQDFRARFRGLIVVEDGGAYHFDSGGARLDIHGKVVRDGQRLELDAGHHEILVEYRRPRGPAHLQLRWRSEYFGDEPIPSSVFFHRDAELEQSRLIEHGRTLVEDHGCVACHAAPGSRLRVRRGPELTSVAARLNTSWLGHWLAGPMELREQVTMPMISSLRDPRVRRNVIAFLESLVHDTVRPEVFQVTPHSIGRGKDLFDSLGCRSCHHDGHFPLRDLGSKMNVASLAAYLENPEATHPEGWMPSLLLSDVEARQIAAFLGQHRRPELERAFDLNGDAEEGRASLMSSGCLACHRLVHKGEALMNTLAAPPLMELRPGLACLGAGAGPRSPSYPQLDGAERDAISAFLQFYRTQPDVSAAPVYETERQISRLRCTACHELHGEPATEPTRERIPTLSGAGAKLRGEWIDKVLFEDARVHSDLLTRMPRFSGSTLQGLSHGVAAAMGVSWTETPASQKTTAKLSVSQQRGIDFLGRDVQNNGLSCVSCHDFGDFRPLADEKGPQLQQTTSRLRYDWFRRWMLDPGRLVSGTSMPQFFAEGATLDAKTAIPELWAALSMGVRMPKPVGVGAELLDAGVETLPLAGHEAVIQRFPISGASAAAINVGLPRSGKLPPVSYTFDAAVCHVVQIWQGGFLDLRGSLAKNQSYPEVVGEMFYRSDDFPIRLQTVENIPERDFRGYRVVDGLPEFSYEIGNIAVSERVVPNPAAPGVVHEYRIDRLDTDAWFVVDPNQKIKASSTVGPFVDGRLHLPRGTNVRFDIKISPAEEQ